MASKSRNKYDIYNWILKVFSSCSTKEQLDSASKLKDLFLNKCNEKDLILIKNLCRKETQVYNNYSIKINLLPYEITNL